MDQATTFGVEIEGNGFREVNNFYKMIANKINETPYESCTYWEATDDNGRHFQKWEVKSESCSDRYTPGFEITTPILMGDEGMKQFKIVYDHLVKSGMKVNNDCGMHVHVGVPDDYTLSNMISLVKRYRDHEEEIDSFVIQQRRGSNNHYCNTMQTYSNEVLKSYSTTNSLSSFCGMFTRKKLAIGQYVEHGTVEFRQHGATLDSTVAEMWVKFCINFMLTTKLISDGKMEDKGALTGMNEEEVNFFMQRKEYLNASYNNR